MERVTRVTRMCVVFGCDEAHVDRVTGKGVVEGSNGVDDDKE